MSQSFSSEFLRSSSTVYKVHSKVQGPTDRPAFHNHPLPLSSSPRYSIFFCMDVCTLHPLQTAPKPVTHIHITPPTFFLFFQAKLFSIPLPISIKYTLRCNLSPIACLPISGTRQIFPALYLNTVVFHIALCHSP